MHEHGPDELQGPLRGTAAWWRGMEAQPEQQLEGHEGPAVHAKPRRKRKKSTTEASSIRTDLVQRVRQEIAAEIESSARDLAALSQDRQRMTLLVEERQKRQADTELALQTERGRHDRPFRSGSRLAVPSDADDLGILEDGDVEVHRLLGFVVEPQKWRNFLHDSSFQSLDLDRKHRRQIAHDGTPVIPRIRRTVDLAARRAEINAALVERIDGHGITQHVHITIALRQALGQRLPVISAFAAAISFSAASGYK